MKQTLRNKGKLITKSTIIRGSGSVITKDFLDQIATGFVNQCFHYIDWLHEAPFAFGERSISSILAPVISQITPMFLMEFRVTRDWSKLRALEKEDIHGWLDYWCNYRDTQFFIELKFGWENAQTDVIRKDLKEQWKYMHNKQLKTIKTEIKNQKEFCKNAVTIGLQIIPVVQRIKDFDQLSNHEELVAIQKNYNQSLDPNPNWSALWCLHNDLIQKTFMDLEDGWKRYFPGVLLVAEAKTV